MTQPQPKAVVDLHMHTTYSDGILTPTELVRLVAKQGVTIASVTDHDSTEGLDEAFAEAEAHPGLRLIPGIEISTDHPTDPTGDLHVLGYFLDRSNPELQGRLTQFREDRDHRAERMVERLAQLGMPVDFERVREIAGEAGIGRPHIAQAMVERGYIRSVPEAFDGYLNDGGSAHASRPHIAMDEAASLIHRAHGVAVLAHPIYATNYEQVLETIADAGFVGFEAHYASFDAPTRRHLLALADRLGLLPCGGSDYHGPGTSGEHLPGSAGPPVADDDELERLAKANAGE